jgi:hypothetical protein
MSTRKFWEVRRAKMKEDDQTNYDTFGQTGVRNHRGRGGRGMGRGGKKTETRETAVAA